MQGGDGIARSMTWVFFWLIMTPKKLQVSENLSISLRSLSCWCDTMATSSGNNSSLNITVLVFVLAHNLEMLKRWPLDLEWRYTPSVDDLKVCFKSKAKKMSQKAGASIQPCLSPILTQMDGKICVYQTVTVFIIQL